MPSYILREGTWRAQIRLAGIPSESATFPTKGRAVAWAIAREQELKALRRDGVVQGTLGQAMTKYKLEVSPTKRGSKFEVLRLNALAGEGKRHTDLPKLPLHKMLDDVTVLDMTTWQAARLKQVSIGTVLREINLLRAVFEAARRDWNWCSKNPIKDVRKPPKPAPRSRVMQPQEVDRILLCLGYPGDVKSANVQVAVCLLLALETAMRAGEIVGLTWADVHPKYVSLPMTKNGDQRNVPLSTKAVSLIESMRGVDKVVVFTVSNQSLDVLFRRARDKCKIEGLHFHDSRATACTRLAKVLTVMELARMIGHRDPKSLMIYFRETAAEISDKLG